MKRERLSLVLRGCVMSKHQNIIVVLDDGETWSGAGSICAISDEAMELLEEGVKFRQLDGELDTDNWCEVIAEGGYDD